MKDLEQIDVEDGVMELDIGALEQVAGGVGNFIDPNGGKGAEASRPRTPFRTRSKKMKNPTRKNMKTKPLNGAIHVIPMNLLGVVSGGRGFGIDPNG